MGSRLENVIRMAVHTFSQRPNGTFLNSNLHENIQRLRQLVEEIDPAQDLGFTRETGQPQTPARPPLGLLFRQPAVAPVTYMEVFENRTVSIGVFILKEGACIPLHDHIGMYGILKVLYGNLNLQSYSPVDLSQTDSTPLNHFAQHSKPPKSLTAHKLPVALLTETDGSTCLTPGDRNLHQITAVGGSVSFLDVLSPPYSPEDDRDCYYYKEEASVNHTDMRILSNIPCPPSFWCNSLPYSGPDLQHLYLELSS